MTTTLHPNWSLSHLALRLPPKKLSWPTRLVRPSCFPVSLHVFAYNGTWNFLRRKEQANRASFRLSRHVRPLKTHFLVSYSISRLKTSTNLIMEYYYRMFMFIEMERKKRRRSLEDSIFNLVLMFPGTQTIKF